MATTDLSPTIGTAAGQPLSAQVDGQMVGGRPIDQICMADRYIAAKAARGKFLRNVFCSKLLPAGPVSDQQQTNPATAQFYPWF